MSFIKSFVGRKTVDSVMSAFHAAIDDLELVKQERRAAAEQHAKAIMDASYAHTEAMMEADHADRLITRLSEIVK